MTKTKSIQVYEENDGTKFYIPQSMVDNMEKGKSGSLIISMPHLHESAQPVVIKKDLPTGIIDQAGRAMSMIIGRFCGKLRWCRVVAGLISLLIFLFIASAFLFIVALKK